MFNPLPSQFLDSREPLTKSELSDIERSIDQSDGIIDLCGHNDFDVLEYHERYLTKLIERLENSINAKQKRKGKLCY